jgi:hypothetical protein
VRRAQAPFLQHARRRERHDVAAREGQANKRPYAFGEGNGLRVPIGPDILRQGAMGDEASRPIMWMAALGRDQPMQEGMQLVQLLGGFGSRVERKWRPIKPSDRLELELDRRAFCEEPRRGVADLSRGKIFIDRERDMRA